MGKEKAGFLTPKAIANRIKSKGLQKLRWYCQMCHKQCRDENGFKCHLTSEAHQRQLLLFAEDPEKFVDTYSEEFLETFVELLKRRYGTKRVHCNIVYQEYITDREHTHMNSTQWETLTEFVQWMGREGYCKADETEKGWFVQYIDRDPEAIRKQEATQKKEKMDLDDEEKTLKFIQEQIERANAAGRPLPEVVHTELLRSDEQEKVTISLKGLTAKKSEQESAKPSTSNALSSLAHKSAEHDKADTASGESSASSSKQPEKRKARSALDDIMEMEQKKKEKKNRRDDWIHAGIVVKVITKKVGEKYYKKKALIREVVDKYGAVCKMIDSGDKLRLDQAHLETVIPACGKPVMVVNGTYRGSESILMELNEKKFSCTVKIDSGTLKGRVVDGVAYEDISKLYIAS